MLGVLIFVVIGGVAFLIHSLPSTKSISEVFHKKEVILQKSNLNLNKSDSLAEKPEARAISEDLSLSDPAPVEEKDLILKENVLQSLLNPEEPLSDFCRHLSRSSSELIPNQEMNQAFLTSENSEEKDPRVQALKPILKYFFQQPEIIDFIQQAQSLQAQEGSEFWNKAAFYTQALSVFNKVLENKTKLEGVADQSYLLLKMNDLVAKKPELLSSPLLTQYCAGVENKLNQNGVTDFHKDKQDFLSLLDQLRVSPQEIGFDPEYQTRFDLKFDGESILLEGGWVDERFGGESQQGARK